MQSNSLSWDNKNTVERVCQEIKRNKIILSTTDTVLGLLANVSQNGRIELDNLKQRSKKPYLILVDSKKQALLFINPLSLLQIEKSIDHCWPGPVTLIVKAHDTVPSYATSKDRTVALRVPNHSQLQRLLRCTGPLFSTSANKTGNPIPNTIEEVDQEIKHGCGLIVDDSIRLKGKQNAPIASTILDCTGKDVRIVREGAYPLEQLKRWF